MRMYILILVLALLFYAITSPASAEGWQWRRIAWEGTRLQSVVSPPDSQDVIYVDISSGVVQDSATGVYKSADGGISWRFLSQSNNVHCYGLTINPLASEIVYCGTGTYLWDPDGWVWRSRDAGENWDRHFETYTHFWPSPWRENVIFATQTWNLFDKKYSVSRSTDYGATWETVCSRFITTVTDRVVYHREDSLMVFAGLAFDAPESTGLGRSIDGGDSWEIVLETEGLLGFDQHPFDADRWVALLVSLPGGGIEDVTFAESFDNGDTWETWPPELDFSVRYARRLLFDLNDPQILYLLNPLHAPGLDRSTDGGHTWLAMEEGLSQTAGINDIFLVVNPPGEILATSFDGLWKWTDQQSCDPEPGSLPTLFRIDSVYPVPFSRSVRAELTMRRSGTVAADVYSTGGALIRRLFKSNLGEGLHSIIWDGGLENGRMVAPGTYILRVETEKSQASRILVKLR